MMGAKMYEWITTEDLLVTFLGDDGATGALEARPRLLVRDSGCRYAVVLSFGDDDGLKPGRLLFNGEDVEVENFMAILGMFEELDDRTQGDLEKLDDETFLPAEN